MHDPDKNPETLLSVPNDLEAAMIVSALAAHQVDATTSGEFTSGFRAEAPGEVKVLVRRCDLERARRVLRELTGNESPARAESGAVELASWRVGTMSLGFLLVVFAGIGLLLRCQ